MAAAGLSSGQPAFWALPAALVGGAAAAAGFVSTYALGWKTVLTYSTSASLYLFAGLIIFGVLVLAIPVRSVNR
ncbi:MAG: hypothetical protein ABSB70_12445 [Candidatus Velthaea sp.]